MDAERKNILNKEVILGGFLGGCLISLLELAYTVRAGDYQLVTVYFFIGCIASGFIGVVGTFMSNARDFRNAISAGIAAPSVLGSMIQSGVAKAATVAALSIFGTPAYADTTDTVRYELQAMTCSPGIRSGAVELALPGDRGGDIDTISASDGTSVAQAEPVRAQPVQHFLRALGVRN
jgi:hypothetical protein